MGECSHPRGCVSCRWDGHLSGTCLSRQWANPRGCPDEPPLLTLSGEGVECGPSPLAKASVPPGTVNPSLSFFVRLAQELPPLPQGCVGRGGVDPEAWEYESVALRGRASCCPSNPSTLWA